MSGRLDGVVTRKTSPPAGDNGDRNEFMREPDAVDVRSDDTRIGLGTAGASKGEPATDDVSETPVDGRPDAGELSAGEMQDKAAARK